VDGSKETILALYRSSVRLYLVKDIKLVESVQRRATKNYDDRLNYLGLMRLEKRRVRSDLIETFEFMKGMYDVEKEIFF